MELPTRWNFRAASRQHALKVIGETTKRGTNVHFWADDQIFCVTNYDYDLLLRRLRELAFLNKGIKITYRDERDTEHPEVRLYYEGGVVSFVEYFNENKIPLFPKPIYIHGVREVSDGPVEFEVAMQWNDTYIENLHSYVNNIGTRQGGTHVYWIFYCAHSRTESIHQGPQPLKNRQDLDFRRRYARRTYGGHLCESPQSSIRRADETKTWQ